jgi:hypothetical protein
VHNPKGPVGELAKREAGDAYVVGKTTLRELSRSLGLDVWGVHDLLASEGVAVAQGRRDETWGDLEAMLIDLR